MNWRRTALTLAFAACALGCGSKETAGRARLWTLFDLQALAAAHRNVAGGGEIVGGLPASSFVTPRQGEPDGAPTSYELVVAHGFLDGLPMDYVTTELWANVDAIWVQPLYRAIDAEGRILEDPTVREPWVFGVGPDSLFYSPYWQVFGFEVPAGVDVTSLLDTRAVLEAANKTGGLRSLERRITALAPATLSQPSTLTEQIYLDDTAAWDGTGGARYLDLGPGRFTYSATAVVQEFPIFIFTKQNAAGLFAPVGWPSVGASRQLFSLPPSVGGVGAVGSGTGGATGNTTTPLDPLFGGLWRLYTVELPDAAALDPATGRVVKDVECLNRPNTPCVVLDSQSAVEALGPAAIHRTELLASCPLLQLGTLSFGVNQPQPQPSAKP